MSTSRHAASAPGDDRAAVGAFGTQGIDTGETKERAIPTTTGGEGAAVGALVEEIKAHEETEARATRQKDDSECERRFVKAGKEPWDDRLRIGLFGHTNAAGEGQEESAKDASKNELSPRKTGQRKHAKPK